MIRINGKIENYAVNLSGKIEFNWNELEAEQDSYQLKVIDENDNVIFYEEEKETKAPFTTVYIEQDSELLERKKLKVQLIIFSKNTEAYTKEVSFYSENKQLSSAEWITRKDNPIEKEVEYYKDKPNIILTKTFSYDNKEDKEVFLDICGLGYYKVTVNNVAIDSYYLNSDVTKYDKLVYYDTYKINEFFQDGKNKIEVELANGWYEPAPFELLGKYNIRKQLSIGKPCLIAQITTLNNNQQELIVETNKSWESQMGNYLFNNIYIGEKISFREIELEKLVRGVEFTTVSISGPSGKLAPSNIPKIVRSKKHKPISIKEVKGGYLIEFNQVISGHFCCTVISKDIADLDIKYGESIYEDEIDFNSSVPGTYTNYQNEERHPVIQNDKLNLAKGTNNFENQFTYHSFRYVFITSENLDLIEIENIHAYSVHTDMGISSSFESSNPWLNQLYEVGIDTKLNNIHSYYEDCPRERLGYGGDIVALIESQIYSFQSKELLEKVWTDFELEQNNDGGIPQTAPFIGIQTHGTSNRAGSLGWQYVMPVILKKLIRYYNSAENYTDKFIVMKKHINYLLKFDYDYIKHCCLGDWGGIDTALLNGKETPPDRDFCSAVFYLLLLKDYKDVLVQLDDQNREVKNTIHQLTEKLEEVKIKITKEFYNESGYFGTGSQSSYAFALKANLGVSQELLYHNFIDKIKSDDYAFRTGIFGMSWTYEVLKKEDQSLIYKWLTRTQFPSFFKMLENGNNILPEYFTDNKEKYLHASKNHAMFSSYGAWILKSILGITIELQSVASNRTTIEPFFPEELTFAKGHFKTPRGKITVSWHRKEKEIEFSILVPSSIEVKFDSPSKIVKKEDKGFYTSYLMSY